MAASKSDTELMLDFQKGHEQAFAELVERYRLPLLNFFYRLSWDRQTAEDCCQEVFCRVFRRRKEYVPTASFPTYLYRIGKNLWIDRYRARRNAPEMASLDAEVGDGGQTLGAAVDAGSADPSRGAETRDELRCVRRALDALAPELRETLVLVKYQGLKYAEAAEVLGVPVGTVRSRIHAAIEQVRSLLRREAGRAGREGRNGQRHEDL